MCGEIKYEGVGKLIGKLVICNVKNNDKCIYLTKEDQLNEANILGHSRIESKIPINSTEVIIPAKFYTERNVEFNVPKGKGIAAFLIHSDNFPNKQGLFIQTRSSTKEELIKCKHGRHPVCELPRI